MVCRLTGVRKAWYYWLVLTSVMICILTGGAVSEEACKFSYLGFPEDLNDSQVIVPEDVVAMSDFIPVGTPTEIVEQFIGGTPSIVFIIDNSSSMSPTQS